MPSKTRTPVNTTSVALRLGANRSLWEGLVDYDAVSRYYARLALSPSTRPGCSPGCPARAPSGTTTAAAPARSSSSAAC